MCVAYEIPHYACYVWNTLLCPLCLEYFAMPSKHLCNACYMWNTLLYLCCAEYSAMPVIWGAAAVGVMHRIPSYIIEKDLLNVIYIYISVKYQKYLLNVKIFISNKPMEPLQVEQILQISFKVIDIFLKLKPVPIFCWSFFKRRSSVYLKKSSLVSKCFGFK